MTTAMDERLTAACANPDISTVLVLGQFYAGSDADAVSVGPGAMAWCDGDRWRVPVVVSAGPPTEREDNRRFNRAEFASAVTYAVDLTHRRSPDVLNLRRRSALAEHWSSRTLRRAERQLADAAREVGATVVTWAGCELADEAVCERYDLLLES